ncbi:hypothetical protein [Nocardiopsis sp. NPDC060348]|uniref:hypothetical protein n=1 Tax=unclassified Nocardiopsis TaxID=2649073 RepID=UPI003649918A
MVTNAQRRSASGDTGGTVRVELLRTRLRLELRVTGDGPGRGTASASPASPTPSAPCRSAATACAWSSPSPRTGTGRATRAAPSPSGRCCHPRELEPGRLGRGPRTGAAEVLVQGSRHTFEDPARDPQSR